VDDLQLRRLLEEAAAWREADPEPSTRAEVDDLVARATESTPDAGREDARLGLADRFAGSLQFGTAGLRGALGAGPNRMNRATVIRAAAGLAAYLTGGGSGAGPGAGGPPRVVVGFDARHGSRTFASDSCAVLAAAGCEVFLLPGPLPTPVLAFAVRHLGCEAGVMVTASHNPPQDNGYKVYLGGRADDSPGRGAQIVPPADAGIAARIAAAGRAVDVPMAASAWTGTGPGIVDDYLLATASVVRPGGPRDVQIVLTPLHGVGGNTVVRALRTAGFPAPHLVPEQAEPDPDFPTVAFPNPEEPGAMDLALAAARSRGADLVIANDPDADRCAVAVPDPGTDGGWRVLRGDEVGALLGEHLLARAEPPPDAVVACSIVSSQLLARIAAAHGVRFEQTLTGFKWLARVPGLYYGYEEALGYCVAPDQVRDKDGISAALVVLELAAALKASGRSLLDALDDLARRHGVHATDQLSFRVDDVRLITAALARLQGSPPRALAGGEVTELTDLAAGADGLPPTEGLRLRTADGVRAVVRPSGTEPKLKCYLEAVVPVTGGSAADLDRARAGAAARLATVRAELSELLGL
jgi:phosphomannomutase